MNICRNRTMNVNRHVDGEMAPVRLDRELYINHEKVSRDVSTMLGIKLIYVNKR